MEIEWGLTFVYYLERVWDSIAVCEIRGLLIAAQVFGIISLVKVLKDLQRIRLERLIFHTCIHLVIIYSEIYMILKKFE